MNDNEKKTMENAENLINGMNVNELEEKGMLKRCSSNDGFLDKKKITESSKVIVDANGKQLFCD